MVLTTRYAELSPVFVALSKKTTLGIYDTRNRPFAFNVKCNGTVGKFTTIPTTRQLKCGREIEWSRSYDTSSSSVAFGPEHVVPRASRYSKTLSCYGPPRFNRRGSGLGHV